MKRYLYFLLLLLGGTMLAQKSDKITIEAASSDPTLVVRGLEKEVNVVNNPQWSKTDNSIMLFTSAYGIEIKDSRTNLVAVQVDAKMKVTKLLNHSENGQIPLFSEVLSLSIPLGGFILIASDNNYNTKGFKKFLAENFHEGDVVKLRMNGEPIILANIDKWAKGKQKSILEMDIDPMLTSLVDRQLVSGHISHSDSHTINKVTISGQGVKNNLKIDNKGFFKGEITLHKGVNYYDVKLTQAGHDIDQKSLVVFRKDKNSRPSEIVLWVEQFPNAKTLKDDIAVESMLQKAKQAGFTTIGLDVKGPEGFVSYRKNEFSKSPYFTKMINPDKYVEDTGFDLLKSMLVQAHKLGLKVLVSFNFFTEGNVTSGDYAVLKQHRDWEEIVQRPEDKGNLLRISESTIGKEAVSGKRLVLAFVNPANKEVQDFQLSRVEEVLKNYEVDGIVLDRCRYDNLYADFGSVTRNAFSDYLRTEGMQLNNFPNDAFRIDDQGNIVKGKCFLEWVTFRSQTIKLFTERLRTLVNQYKSSKNPELKMTAYVGSWYESYYQNGVNWASSDFIYNEKLGFPESEIYTDKYYKTSFLGNLDFLMIGTYYKTRKEINKYITLGNILTNGQLPLLGSMSLTDLKNEQRSEVFKASLSESAGLMIFDLCYVHWDDFLNQMKLALRKN